MPDMTPDERYVAELEDAIEKIWDIARRFGLDPYPTHFELVPSTIMYEFGSYGLPGRFSHWSRGKAYYRMKTEYDYGLSKIYELVVNTNPSYAFLMEQNDLLQNKVVVAHVLGHTDFFKNNIYFKHTAGNMIDKVSVNADRIRKYEYEHGQATVERFLDSVLAIEEHIDPNFRIKKAGDDPKDGERKKTRDGVYDDLWTMDERVARRRQDEAEERRRLRRRRFPPEPEKDLLLFLAQHAPNLEEWQRDILLIVREEMQYFVPQMQTKTINEGWACLVGSSLVLTEHGLLRYDALYERLAQGDGIAVVSGGKGLDAITDRHKRHNAPTIRLRTKRGLTIEGAEEHKLSVGPDEWIALKDVQVGQRIPLSVGTNVWPQTLVPLAVPQLMPAATVAGVAATAKVSAHTVYRYFGGKTRYAEDRIARAIEQVGFTFGHAGKPVHGGRTPLVAPAHVTPEFAEFLGYLVGDGNIHTSKHAIGFTSGDRELAERYAALVTDLFAIEPKVFWDDRTANGKGGRWRVVFYSTNVLELLASIGIDLHAKAREKRIPDVILRSPKAVVSPFLRAYLDCDGCASLKAGVILSTFSDEIAQTLQILLLNYGILSRKYGPNIQMQGRAAEHFEREIGFGLTRKAAKLRQYIANHRWMLTEDPTDVVVSIEHGVADVYDITVERSHRYVANGLLHHNSFWHARIMRELNLTDGEAMAFAQMHSGVLAPSRMRINPYHLGYHILQDIERRWDNPTPEEREKLGRQPGQGRQKLFEVRETESDLSLLRNYLTKELVEELDLYLYRKEGDEWVIVEKNWERVRDGIISSMTNFGYPFITVVDADFNGNTELVLNHQFEEHELDMTYAQKTLEYVYYIWSRPVHLETVYEEQKVRLSYNGDKHTRTSLEPREKEKEKD
ncbi:MAG TPA: SpoVR family protein [Ktedonobacterales bacterium]|nr:SpoVR family protein [Ktedonobacterales bacterium]